MSRPTKADRELQQLTDQGLVDKSGIRIGSDAVKLTRKPAALVDHRQLFRDYEELHGLEGPGNQDLATDRSELKNTGPYGSGFSTSNRKHNPNLENHWLVSREELETTGWKGNYKRRYENKAKEQWNIGLMATPFGNSGSRWGNAAARFVPSAAAKFVGSLGHAGGAVIDAISGMMGYDTKLTYDNLISNYAKKAEKGIENYFHIYNRSGYENTTTMMGKAGYAEFWTQDVADGFEYVASNLVGGLAGKGVKAGAMVGKAALGFKTAAQAGQAASGMHPFLRTLGFATAMTMGESGTEAAESYAHIKQKLRGKINKKTGEKYTTEEIEEKAMLAADATWRGNMAILMPSNMFMASVLFKPAAAFKASQKAQQAAVNNVLRGKNLGSATTKGFRSGAKAAGMGVVSEGLYEENFQLAVSRMAERFALEGDKAYEGERNNWAWLAGKAAGDWTGSVMQSGFDGMGAFFRSFQNDLNAEDREAAMSIMIGSIIGGGMAIKEGISTYKQQKALNDQATAAANAIKGDAALAARLFTDDFSTVYKGTVNEDGKFEPEMDANGELQVDWDAARNLFYRRLYDEKLSEEMTRGIAAGDEYHVQATRDLALSRLVHGLAQLEAKQGKWGKRPNNQGIAQSLFEEQVDEMIEAMGEDAGLDKQSLKQEAEKYLAMWKNIQKSTKVKDVAEGITTGQFENIYQKVLFHNQVKLDTYKKFLARATEEGNNEAVAQIEELIKDTEDYLGSIAKNKKEVSKRWADELYGGQRKRARIVDISKKLQNAELEKDERAKLQEEKEILEYEIMENRKIHGVLDGGRSFSRTSDDYHSNELSIAEHESEEVKGKFGIKHDYFFKKGQAAMGAADTQAIMEEMNDLNSIMHDESKTPEERESAMKSLDAKRKELANTIRGNSKYATPEMIGVLEQLEQEASDTLAKAEEAVKDKKQQMEDLRQKLEEVEKELNSLIGNSEAYTREASEALSEIGDLMGLNGLPPTGQHIQDELKGMTPEDRATFVDNYIGQIRQFLNENPELTDDINTYIEAFAPTLVSENPGVAPVDALEMGLQGHRVTPHILELQQQKRSITDEITQAQQELEGLEKNRQKEDTFYNNTIVPTVLKVNMDVTEAQELHSNKDNNNYWRRQVANEPVDKTEQLKKNAEANPDVFTDLDTVAKLRSQLQTLQTIYNARMTEDGSKLMKDTVEFKGLMDAIEKALADLKELQKLAQENEGKRSAKQQQVLNDKAMEDLRIIGLTIDADGNIQETDPKVAEEMRKELGADKINQILNDAETTYEKGVAARIILQLFKDKADKTRAAILNHLNTTLKAHEKALTKRGYAKELFLSLAEIVNGQYFRNPGRLFDSALLVNIRAESIRIYESDPQHDPFFIFEETRDLAELETNIQNSKLPQAYKDAFNELMDFHREYSAKVSLRDALKSDYNYAEQFISEDEILNVIANRGDKIEEKHVPTGEQLVAIRQLVNHFRNVGNFTWKTNKGKVMAYLRGIPGTGKTKMVLKWVTDILGLAPSQMYSFSHNAKSSAGIAESTGTNPGSMESFLDSSNSFEGIELLIIDEVGFFDATQADLIEKRINQINAERAMNKKRPLAVIGLGDPSQITRSVHPPVELNSFMVGMETINPLTQSYRSNVPTISRFFKLFLRNPKKIEGVSVTANVPVGTPWNPKEKLVGVHTGNTASDLLTQLEMMKKSGRSKVIVVNTEADKARYTNAPVVNELVNNKELEVMTYDEVQGQTFDEVYIDLDPTGNDLRGNPFSNQSNSLEFNKGMYTAISRAKYYVFNVDPTMKNSTDDTLIENKEKADEEIKQAFVNYTNRHSREKEMLSEHLLTQEQRDNLKETLVNSKTPTEPELPQEEPVDLTDEMQEPEESKDVYPVDNLDLDLNDPAADDPQSTDNNESLQGELTFGKGGQFTDKDGNEILSISNPEYAELNKPEEDGIVPQGAPVIMVKVEQGGKSQTKYLGQVFRNGKWQEEWSELGIMSNKDRSNKVYENNVKEQEDAFQNGKTRPAKHEGHILKGTGKAIQYASDGRAIVDVNAHPTVVGQATLKGSSTLAFNYGDNYQQKGSINKLMSLFTNIFGKGITAQVKIYKHSDLPSKKTRGTGRGFYAPLPGVPYLVVNVNGRQLYARLTPRKINRNDFDNGKFKPVKELMGALRKLAVATNSTPFGHVNLGNPAFNTLMKKMKKNFERDPDSGKPVYAANNYTFEMFKKDIASGVSPEMKELEEMTEEVFQQYIEAAKTVVPSFYGYRIKPLSMNQAEVNEYLKTNPSSEMVTEAEAGFGQQRDDHFLIMQDATAKGHDRFAKDYILTAAKGPAQGALNALARSHTKDDIFPYRVRRKIAGSWRSTAKSLMTDRANLDKTKMLEAARDMMVLHMEVSGKYTEAEIKNHKKNLDTLPKVLSALKSAAAINGLSEMEVMENIDSMRREFTTNPITLEGLEKMFGDSMFDAATGEHVGSPGGAYLAMPLHLPAVNSAGQNLTSENIEHIENQMGTKIDTIQPTTVQLNFGQPQSQVTLPSISPLDVDLRAAQLVETGSTDLTNLSPEDVARVKKRAKYLEKDKQEREAREKKRLAELQEEAEKSLREEQEALEKQDEALAAIQLLEDTMPPSDKYATILDEPAYEHIAEMWSDEKYDDLIKEVHTIVDNYNAQKLKELENKIENLDKEKKEIEDNTLKVISTEDFGSYGKFRIVEEGGEIQYQKPGRKGDWKTIKRGGKKKYETARDLYDLDIRNNRNLDADEIGGQAISLKNARRLAKTYLPGLRIEGDATWAEKLKYSLLGARTANDVVVKFVTKEVLDSMAKPGENLFGLYKDGVAYILKSKDSKGDWVVHEESLKHEVFHKIFNEYLSPQERRKLRLAAARHFKRNDIKSISAIEFEELLAREFQKYATAKKPQVIKGRLGNFFNNILKWFGFVQENENELLRMFDAIQTGRFHQGYQLYPDYVGRKTLREIHTLFGDVNTMKDMITEVRTLYNNVLNDHTTAYSMEDVYGVVVRKIREDADKFANDIANGESAIEEVQEELTEMLEAASKMEALGQTKTDAYEEVQDEIFELREELAALKQGLDLAQKKGRSYSKLAQEYGKNNKLKAFETIAEWLFPSWEFGRKGTEHVPYAGEVSVEVDPDMDTAVEEIIENFNLQDVIQDRDKVNQETKLSAAVKLFLGSVKFPKLNNKTGEIKDAYMTGRAAFIKMLDLIEGLSFSSDNTFMDQFKEAALEATGSTRLTDASFKSGIVPGLYRKIKELYDQVINDEYYDEEAGEYVALPDNAFFYDNNTFITTNGISDLKVDELRKASKAQLENWSKEGKLKIYRKDVVMSALRKTQGRDAWLTTNDFVMEVQRATEYNKRDMLAMFKQQEAQNTLAEMMSHMGSLREKHVKIAEVETEFGVTTIKYIYTGQGLSMKTSLRSTLDDAVETLINKLMDENPRVQDGNLEKGESTAMKQVYDYWLENDWPAIADKLGSRDINTKIDGIKTLLDELGMHDLARQPIPRTNEARNVANELKFFFGTHMAGQTKDQLGVGEYQEIETKDSVEEGFTDSGRYQVATPKSLLEDQGSVFNKLATLLQFNEEWIRATSMRNSKGDTVFAKTQSTQADDILNVLSKIFGNKDFKGSGEQGSRKLLRLPPHLRTSFFQDNIFTKGINKINNIVDHDGFRDSRTGRATSYTREGKADWFSRNFNAAFISTVRNSLGGNLTYDQSIYTTSNRPNIRHVNMQVLGEEGIRQALEAFVDQVTSRPYSILEEVNGEKNEDGVKNFQAGKYTNFEIFREALNRMHGYEKAGEKLANLDYLKKGILNDKAKLVNHMWDIMGENAKEVAKEMMDANFVVTSDVNKAVSKLAKQFPEMFETPGFPSPLFAQDKQKRVKSLNKDKKFALNQRKFENLVTIWYMNNYVNSYFVNQLVAGDSNFFKNSLDQVKRMSGVFAPGLKGLVHEKLGMREKFKVAVIEDVEGKASQLRDFLSRLLGDYESYSQLKDKVDEIAKQEAAGKKLSTEELETIKYFDQVEELMVKYGEGGYEYGDAQGFITPDRADDISKGFGRAYGAGRVFKGAHYENVVKTAPDGTEVSHPFMLKYSTVVLSDDLVNKYEPLRKLRQAMEDGKIDEAVFASGNKVGKPIVLSSGEAIEKGEMNKFNPKSVVELSNENFRMQSNPDHIAGEHGKGVANPTQLGYFLNVLNDLITDTFDGSSVVYEYVSKLIEDGAKDFLEEYKKGGQYNEKNLKAKVRELLKGKGNERLLELVEEGVDFNAPHIINKVFTQVAAGLASESVQIRFPGEKLTLQSAYGVEFTRGRKIKGIDSDRARHLQYYVDERGHMVAEVIVPKGSIPQDMLEKIKNGEDVYMYADAMGFRIPSTELHSAVALKVVDTYDERGSSMVIAPKELVPLHGSDFDVDSLFMITRESSHFNSAQLDLLNSIRIHPSDPNARFWHESFQEGAPIGHRKGKHVNWVMDKKFPDKIEKAERALFKKWTDRSLPQEEKDLAHKQWKLIKGIRKKFYKNVILDTFLQAITHPDNRARMLSPITMEMFNGTNKDSKKTGLYKEGSIFRMIQEIQVEAARKEKGGDLTQEEYDRAIQIQDPADLSDIRGNYAVYKSNMEGASLTGVFANDIKAMAYMLKSGGLNKGPITQLIEQSKEDVKGLKKLLIRAEENVIKFKSKVDKARNTSSANYKINKEKLEKSEARVKELRNDIKATEAKVKELQAEAKNLEESNRPSLQVDPETGEAPNALKINGQTYGQMVEYTDDPNLGVSNQPIWEIMDALVNAAIDNVKEQILPAINANGLTSNAISAMIVLGVPMSTITMITRQPSIMDMDVSKAKETSLRDAKLKIAEFILGESPVNQTTQQAMSHEEMFEQLDNMTESMELNDKMLRDGLTNVEPDLLEQYLVIKEFEKALNVGKDLSTLSGALNVVRQAPAFKEDLDAMKDKWDKMFETDENGEKVLNSKFSWNIKDLFKVNPHIRVAYKYIIEEFDNMVKSSFLKYAPEFQDALYKSYNRLGINLNPSRAKSRVLYVDEFQRYLMTSLPSLNRPEITQAKYEYVNINNKERTKTGHEAWSQHTLNKMIALKKHPQLKNNRFIQALDIRSNRWSKLKYVRFVAGSNMEYHDNLELQDSFLELAKFSFNESGALEYNENAVGSLEAFNDVQEMFADYAIINFGLQFSSVNYSMALPPKLIAPYVAEYKKEATYYKDNPSKEVEDTTQEGFARAFEDFIDHFELEMALNNASSLPYIGETPVKQQKVLTTANGYGGITVERNQGIDPETGVYYDLKYYIGDRDPSYFKKYISRTHFETGQPVVYVKLKTDSPNNVMYQRVGFGRTKAAYLLPTQVSKNGYNVDRVFNGSMPSIGVDDINEPIVKLPDYLDSTGLEGTIIQVYQYDDVARLNPKYLRVTKVRDSSDIQTKKGFSWKDIFVDVEEVTDEEVQEAYPEVEEVRIGKRKKDGYEPLATSNKQISGKTAQLLEGLISQNDTHHAKVLVDVIAQEPTGYGIIAKAFLNLFGPMLGNFQVKFVDDSAFKTRGDGTTRVVGLFRYDKNGNPEILVNKNATTAEIAETILHEIAHGLTVAVLRLPPNKLTKKQQIARARLRNIYNTFKRKVRKSNPEAYKQFEYALSNIDEFVAATYSDPAFQELLHGYETLDEFDNKPTFLQKIWRAISDMLGISSDDSASLLTDTFASITDLIGDGSVILDYTDQLKGKSWGNVSDAATNTTKKLMERSKDIQVGMDTEGNQLDYYTFKGLGRNLKRVSDQMTGWLSNVLNKLKEEGSKHWIDVKADRLFDQFEDKDHKLFIEGEMRNKEEYIEMLKDFEHKGLAKGNIIHKMMEIALHNGLSQKTLDELKMELGELRAKSTIKGAHLAYEWLWDTLPGLLKRIGLNTLEKDENGNFVYPESERDLAIPEMAIASETLDFAGTVDTVFQHPDGAYTLVDWKTGRSIEKEVMQELFKYGDTFNLVFDNPLNKAKMQLMYYAFMMKVENPALQIRDLVAVWAPNEYITKGDNAINRVEIKQFLEIIENYYRNEDNAKYLEILEKSPNAFNIKHYNGSNAQLIDRFKNPDRDTADNLKMMQTHIKWLMTEHLNIDKMSAEDQQKLEKLFKDYIAIAHDAGYKVENWTEDISRGSEWLGSYNNIDHPAIKIWQKELDKTNAKIHREVNAKMNRFRTLLGAVIEEETGKKPTKFRPFKAFQRKNYDSMYKKLMKKEKVKGQDIWRLIHEEDKEWTDKGRLSDKQKALLTYVNDDMGSYFQPGKGFLTETAVVKDNMELSAIQLFNKQKQSQDQFEYKRGFLPVVPPNLTDMVYKKGGFGNKISGYLKHWYLKNLTYHYENTYDLWEDENQAIPIKYLGSAYQRANELHSFNLETIYEQFTRSIVQKKYGDNLYAVGKSIQLMAKNQLGDKGKALDRWMNKQIEMQAKHRSEKGVPYFRKPIRGLKIDGKETQIDVGKLVGAVSGLTSATVMWIKPFGGARNWFAATGTAYKRGVAQSIAASKLMKTLGYGGITVNDIDYNLREVGSASAVAHWDTLLDDSIMGNLDNNKTWQVMKEFSFLPDLGVMYGQQKEMLTSRLNIATQETAYMFHSLPEEANAAMTMIAMMKAMKFEKPYVRPDGTKVTNMWNAYTIEQVEDEQGNVSTKLQYNGPIRGKIKDNQGNIVDLKGLTEDEVSKMKYIYQEMQGGYREEERTSLQYHHLGKALMKFKTFVPQLLKGAFMSKSELRAIGEYKQAFDDNGKPMVKDGQNVMEWQEGIMEGRWRVMGKALGNWAGTKLKIDRLKNENYKWDNLSKRDKMNLIEGYTTIFWMLATTFGMAGAAAALGWDDDDKRLQFMKIAFTQMNQQYHPYDLAKTSLDTKGYFASFNATWKMIDAVSTLGFTALVTVPIKGLEEGFTREGEFRGWRQTLKTIPGVSSAYSFLTDLAGFGGGETDFAGVRIRK
jgi:hypothetical protein